MKLVYVAGMQHSGSTLTDQLLSQHPDVVGLGEVASFFSPAHMRMNAERWRGVAEAGHCSCGATWGECPFWGKIMPLCGLNSDAPLAEKYLALLAQARSELGDQAVVVDSSKTLAALRFLVDNRERLGLGPDDLRVVLTVKDVRSFAASIARKRGARGSAWSKLRHFNWWLGVHRKLLEYLAGAGVPYRINLYEELCGDPIGFADSTFRWLGLAPLGRADVSHGRSHIAIGNKDFILRNRERVRYDNRWFLDVAVNAIYLLHWRARALNTRLYALSSQDRT